MPLIETLSRLAGARALVHGFLAVAIATGFAIGTPDPAGAQEKSFFKTTAKRSDDLKPFPKWVQVLARYMEEQGKVEGTCKETTFNKCHFKTWSGLIAGLQGQSKKSQLKAVNDYANQALYVRDPKNWGVKDYWASPGQFFAKNGDCEDYAILKFLTLRKLGWKNEEMRILVVRDMNLKIAHAILGVMQKKKRYILDNQMTLVVEDRRIRHYKPIFSVNETSWWRHKPAKRS
jgi:predicted transglutaminase-like cysteine proteinase